MFAKRGTKTDIEEGTEFQPKFDEKGLITCVTVSAETGKILMVAYMNDLALQKTLETGQAHYWSRSRNELWLKGATSGQTQTVISMQTDCDQDCILLKVQMSQYDGAEKSCHTGRESCFYREVIPEGKNASKAHLKFIA